MNKELLRVEHITKKFGKIQALKGVSMSVHEGEIISVVGENGAGKSTLMNVMTGIYQPTSGKIFLHGKETRFKSALDAIKIVKERIEDGANEKAALRLFSNCPFVCINFDFSWLNKVRPVSFHIWSFNLLAFAQSLT